MAQIDDDIRLRFLQAQRQVRFLVQNDADDTFEPEDVERDLRLFSRLRDEEAFDDWLSMGIPTTVEAAIAQEKHEEIQEEERVAPPDDEGDSVDAWSEFRTLFSRKLNNKELTKSQPMRRDAEPEVSNVRILSSTDVQCFDVAAEAAEVTIDTLRDKLNGLAVAHGFESAHAIPEALQRCCALLCDSGAQIAGWETLAPHRWNRSQETLDDCARTQKAVEEMSEAFVAASIDCSAMRARLNESTAYSIESAWKRDALLAMAVDIEMLVDSVASDALRLRFLSLSATTFEATAGQHHEQIRSLLGAVEATIDDVFRVEFTGRRDELENREEDIFEKASSAVVAIDQLRKTPYDLPQHCLWQNRLADVAFESLMAHAAAMLSINASEVNLACTGTKAAQRIKQWVCDDLVSLPEVSFRVMRQESLRVGLSLCASARHILKETGREHDLLWGFRYW